MDKMMSNRAATYQILSKLHPGERFSSIALQKGVCNLSGKKPFVGTCIRYLRMYRDETGVRIVNVDKMKSIYLVM